MYGWERRYRRPNPVSLSLSSRHFPQPHPINTESKQNLAHSRNVHLAYIASAKHIVEPCAFTKSQSPLQLKTPLREHNRNHRDDQSVCEHRMMLAMDI